MSEDLKYFIYVCLKNTDDLKKQFERTGEIELALLNDYAHRYILEMGKQVGYENNEIN